ncbi:MAG TPA: lysylphosphatidylglycerol synthase transmembrane domain-containing protein [Polyangiaceae bacterium]|nr:lysylphosphatidylglycerol synthase transmembrane domain-containing protein [Polyangiaceae bacterium]
MNRFMRRILGAMLLGVLVYGAFVLYTGLGKIHESLGRFHWNAFALALALASSNYFIRFAKWQYYLGRLGVRGVAWQDSLLVFLSGFVLTITPGKVGEVFKSAVLARTHDVPAERTAPIVVAERLTDAIGVIALIVIGSGAFAGGLGWAIAGTLAVCVGVALIVWEAPGLAMVAWMEGRPGALGRIGPKVRVALGSLRVVAGPAALLWPTTLSLVAWACEGVALFVLLRGFGAAVPLGVAIFFYSTATLAGALIPVPGGLGVAEAMIQEQLVRLGGVLEGDATAAMILVRFATLWWAVLVGFMALAILRLRFPERLGTPGETAT